MIGVTAGQVSAAASVVSVSIALFTFWYARRQAERAKTELERERSDRETQLNLMRTDVETATKTHQLMTRSVVDVQEWYSSFDVDTETVTARFKVRCIGPAPLKDGRLFLQDENGERLDGQSAPFGSMHPGEEKDVAIDVGLRLGTYAVVITHVRERDRTVEEARGSYVMTDPYAQDEPPF